MAMTSFSKPASQRMFFRIGDVAKVVNVKPYVLRYWESEFPHLSPQKANSGQRVYKRSDVEMLLVIKHLLYTERYSIEGARNRIRELKKSGELKALGQKLGQGEIDRAMSAGASREIPAAASDEVAENGDLSALSASESDRARALAREIRDLVSKPIYEFFHRL